jgi:hypothetical protein
VCLRHRSRWLSKGFWSDAVFGVYSDNCPTNSGFRAVPPGPRVPLVFRPVLPAIFPSPFCPSALPRSSLCAPSVSPIWVPGFGGSNRSWEGLLGTVETAPNIEIGTTHRSGPSYLRILLGVRVGQSSPRTFFEDPVKRKRALLESNSPRDSRMESHPENWPGSEGRFQAGFCSGIGPSIDRGSPSPAIAFPANFWVSSPCLKNSGGWGGGAPQQSFAAAGWCWCSAVVRGALLVPNRITV